MKPAALTLLLPLALLGTAATYLPVWDDVPPVDVVSDWYGVTPAPVTFARLTVTDYRPGIRDRAFVLNVDTVDKAVLGKDGSLELASGLYAPTVSTGALAALLSIGYAPGAGGVCAQSGSLSAWVTLNRPCGVILTAPAGLVPGACSTFGLLDTTISAQDVVHASVQSYSGTGIPVVHVTATANGSCNLTLQNIGARPLSGRVSINFAVIKSSAQ